ncbi:anti-virulence regulator CigR family protein, partial [Enterobacter ludwigii]|uniref:anti-virulence regulator CigR family protein n=1 Tax=Enterobacter ludwigii TaxID=299767 RepID=UPI0030760EAE
GVFSGQESIEFLALFSLHKSCTNAGHTNGLNIPVKMSSPRRYLARGKPLPPGIAKKTVPASMLGQLPSYPGYEWRVVGDDLVLIALSTAVVTTIINGVFR